MSGILQVKCFETCRNTPQKTSMKDYDKKNSFTRRMLFRKVCSNLL